VRESLQLHVQLRHQRESRQLRGHGAREVVAAQVPAKTHPPGQYPPSFNATCRMEGGRNVQSPQARQHPHGRRDGAREVVFMQVPAPPHPPGQYPPSFNATRRVGVVGTYNAPRLVISPTVVGMVPVTSLLYKNLKNHTLQINTHHRSTRHAGWRVAGIVQLSQARHQPHVRRDGAREVVVAQVPAKPHPPGQYPPSFNATRRVGVVGTYNRPKLVNSPTFVGMVPVRSLMCRYLRPHPPTQPLSDGERVTGSHTLTEGRGELRTGWCSQPGWRCRSGTRSGPPADLYRRCPARCRMSSTPCRRCPR
jgi:hypothetical protein